MRELPVVDCQGCGVCRLHMGYPAFNLPLEQLADPSGVQCESLSESALADFRRWTAMPQELRDQVLGLMVDYVPPAEGELDGACVWQDPATGWCRHHEHRPQVCRDFAVGGSGCLEWRRAYSDRLSHPG